jgi:hypothetical protein
MNKAMQTKLGSDGWVLYGGTIPQFNPRLDMNVCIYLDLLQDYPTLFF